MKLVIIECGKSKIWDKNPSAGAQKASVAYTGPYFRTNRRFAESRGCDWMILSAKYGFMQPDFVIPGNYNVTFARPSADRISMQELKRQVEEQGLSRYDEITVLGGRDYVDRVRESLAHTHAKIEAPFAGYGMGQQMHVIHEKLHEEELAQQGEPGIATPHSAVSGNRAKTDVRPASTVNAETFRKALQRVFAEAKGSFVDVTSGDLHRLVGGYPGRSHKMPVCCDVMRMAMQSGDTILASPPKGRGATLTIRYILPRSSLPLARTDRATLASVLRSTFGWLRRSMRQVASGHKRPVP